MAKKNTPQVIITQNNFEPPLYSPTELEGLKDQAIRLAKHVEILEEEVKNKRAQLIGLEKIILANS